MQGMCAVIQFSLLFSQISKNLKLKYTKLSFYLLFFMAVKLDVSH
jgi:hypothetical protein